MKKIIKIEENEIVTIEGNRIIITKENTTTENSDVIKRKIVIENKVEFMNFIEAANEYLKTIQK